MTYVGREHGTVAQDVGLGVAVNHRPVYQAGEYGKHIGVGVLSALQRLNSGSYTTTFCDLSITIEEVTNPHGGETRFEVNDADELKADGHQPLTALLPSWATSLSKKLITYSAGSIDPIFSVFTQTMFDHAGGQTYVGKTGWANLTLRPPKKWPFKEWVRKPGPLVLGLDTAYLIPPARPTRSISGAVDYRLTVNAITGERLFSPRGKLITQTGTISIAVPFTITWK